MKYGALPTSLGVFNVQPKEMMFYQDMPIKMAHESRIAYESRLNCFELLINAACQDYMNEFGVKKYLYSYIYLSAKNLFQPKGCSYNRKGWHCDGFLSDDINYVWSDCYPTVFNKSDFVLRLDDSLSMKEMEEQALPENDVTFAEGSLLRLDQYNVHRVAEVDKAGMRAFVKITISKNKFDLIGNSHNYLLNYNWPMKPRRSERNVPHSR